MHCRLQSSRASSWTLGLGGARGLLRFSSSLSLFAGRFALRAGMTALITPEVVS
jgi:hypothetical protein